MINLKKSPEEMSEEGEEIELPAYPYGTRIDLEDEHLEALGIDLKVGDTVTIQGRADVVSHSEHESEDHKHKSVSLQITDIDITRGKPDLDESDFYAEVEG